MKNTIPPTTEMKTNDNYVKTSQQLWLPQSFTVNTPPETKRSKSKKRKNMKNMHLHSSSTLRENQTISGDLSIDMLHLPTRINKLLKKKGLNTVFDVMNKAERDFLDIKGFGAKSYAFLKSVLKKKGDIIAGDKVQLDNKLMQLPAKLNKDDLLEVLGFPIRLENSLKRGADIVTVGQFCNYPEKKLIKIRNIGSKSVRYLIGVREAIYTKFGVLEGNNSVPKNTPIEEVAIPKEKLIFQLLEMCGDDRARSVIIKRYGLLNGERQTLEEIGAHYKLTRERIRQIQVKALKRMKHPTSVAKTPLFDLIEEVLFQNDSLLTAEEADSIIPEVLGGSSEDGSSILDLICDLGGIQSCKIGDIPIYSTLLSGISLCRLSEKIISLIKNENLGIDIDSIIRQVDLFKKIRDGRFNSQNFVLKYCKTDPRVEELGLTSEREEIIFRHYTSGFAKRAWVDLIVRVMEQEQMPLHFTEITNKVNDLMSKSDRQLDVRRAHSILIESISFAHSGIHGTYGLTSWGLRKESTTELIEECLRKAGFPLHWKQIYNYVSKYKDSKPGSITSILETNRMFKKVEAGMFWLAED